MPCPPPHCPILRPVSGPWPIGPVPSPRGMFLPPLWCMECVPTGQHSVGPVGVIGCGRTTEWSGEGASELSALFRESGPPPTLLLRRPTPVMAVCTGPSGRAPPRRRRHPGMASASPGSRPSTQQATISRRSPARKGSTIMPRAVSNSCRVRLIAPQTKNSMPASASCTARRTGAPSASCWSARRTPPTEAVTTSIRRAVSKTGAKRPFQYGNAAVTGCVP